LTIDGHDAMFLDELELHPKSGTTRVWTSDVGLSTDPTDNDGKWGDRVTNRGHLYKAMIFQKDPSKYTGVTTQELTLSGADMNTYLIHKLQWCKK
jgi:hypothetical protein